MYKIHICMYVCMYICMCVYACMYARMMRYVCLYVMYTYMHTYKQTYIHTYIHNSQLSLVMNSALGRSLAAIRPDGTLHIACIHSHNRHNCGTYIHVYVRLHIFMCIHEDHRIQQVHTHECIYICISSRMRDHIRLQMHTQLLHTYT